MRIRDWSSDVCSSDLRPSRMRRKTGKTAVARACMGGSGPAYVRAQVRPLAGDGVERPLQDVGGRHLVDDLGTALAGHVGLADQEALDRGGGEPLVPEDRKSTRLNSSH